MRQAKPSRRTAFASKSEALGAMVFTAQQFCHAASLTYDPEHLAAGAGLRNSDEGKSKVPK